MNRLDDDLMAPIPTPNGTTYVIDWDDDYEGDCAPAEDSLRWWER